MSGAARVAPPAGGGPVPDLARAAVPHLRHAKGPCPPARALSHRGCTAGPPEPGSPARQCRPSVSIPRADEDNLGGGVTAITHTPYGDDARTAPQLFPQPSDMSVDGARVVAPRALVPHGPEQLFPGHGPVRRAQQVLQQRELLVREGDGPAVDGDLARRRVDDDLVSRRGEPWAGDVTIDGRSVAFTYKEFALLEYLLRSPHRAVTREELLRSCLLYTSDAADEEDSVDLGGRRII